MAATAGALSLVIAKFGRAARARSLNNRTASQASREPTSTAPCSSGTERQGTRHTTSPLTLSGSREVASTAKRLQLRDRGEPHRPNPEYLVHRVGPDNGDAIYFSTTKDLECPTANPNVYTETAPLTVSGGTGAFKSATGEGSLALTVLNSPQIGWGTFTASVTY
jgi:hypothetical protein